MKPVFTASLLLATLALFSFIPQAAGQDVRQWDFPPGGCPNNALAPFPARADEAPQAYYFPARTASFGQMDYPAAVIVSRMPCATAPHAAIQLTIAPLPGRETTFPRIQVIQNGIDHGCAGVAHGETTGIIGWPGLCTDFSWVRANGRGPICDNPMFCTLPAEALRLAYRASAVLSSNTRITSFNPDQAFTLRLTGHGPNDIATVDIPVPARNAPGNVSRLPSSVAGHWWNPAEPGWGLILDRNERGVLFAAWLTYDDAGRSTWYLMSNSQETEPGVISGPVYALLGQPFSQPEAPNTSAGEVVGQFRFSFSFNKDGTSDKGEFRYTVNGRSGTAPIEQLLIREPSGRICAPPARGALEVVGQMGWAANIEGSAGYSQFCGTQATFLTYDDAGKPMWLFGSLKPNVPRPNDSSANSALFGALHRPSGTPYGLAWDASRFAANAPVGFWDSSYVNYFNPQPLRKVTIEIGGAQRMLEFKRFTFEY